MVSIFENDHENFYLVKEDNATSFFVNTASPNSYVDLSFFKISDLEEIFYEKEYDNKWDYDYWCYGKLKDGRYFSYFYEHDTTFCSYQLYFANSKEDIERYGLDDKERQLAGIIL